jgi:hypothetical protein
MVDGDQYVERITSVMKQFKMVREALNTLEDPAKLAAVADEEVSSTRKVLSEMFRKSLALKGRPTESAAVTAEQTSSSHTFVDQYFETIRNEAMSSFLRQVEDARNRVNQNELILLVALFEMQMKDIHREVLRLDPSLLNADRQVPLGRIIAEGSEAVIRLEIEREVQSMDRKSLAERATHFQQRLRIDWPDNPDVSAVRRVVEARNRVLHEDPGMTVSDDQLQEVLLVALFLPFHCCRQCVERYPAGFRQWEGWLKQETSSADS